MKNENSSVKKGKVKNHIRIDGKTALITGANSGIGFETALDLAKRGAKIIMGCRNIAKAEEAKQKILEEVNNAVILVKHLDLASLSSVRSCADDVIKTEKRLDILINNAGIALCPQSKTVDGFEMQMGVNHIGHFLFTNLLLDLLKRSAPSRIVIVSSIAYLIGSLNWRDIMSQDKYDAFKVYGNSKLANIHHCLELSRRLEGTGVICNAVHPGLVTTNLAQSIGNMQQMRLFWRLIFKIFLPLTQATNICAKQGAQPSVYCAIAPELSNTSGKFYNKFSKSELWKHARNKSDAAKLWQLSEVLTKEKEHEDQKTSMKHS